MTIEDFGGFALRGYRSFGSDEMQVVGPLRKLHLVVGRNNVGKSNILHFAHDALQHLRTGLATDLAAKFSSGLDWPHGWEGDRAWGFSIGLFRTDRVRALLFEGHLAACAPLFDHVAFTRGFSNMIWFDFTATARGSNISLSIEQIAQAAHAGGSFSLAPFNQASLALTGMGGGSEFDDYMRVVK